jgi:hypothetical protein
MNILANQRYTVTNTDLTTAAFDVTALCAAGFAGTPVVEMCKLVGGEYTLSGCAQNICSTPADTTGYVITIASLYGDR